MGASKACRLFVCMLSACTDPMPSETGGDFGVSDNPGPVHVDVTREGAPIEGVRVVFQAADSEIFDDVLTTSNGAATGKVTRGGFVTVIQTSDVNTTVITYTDIVQGDRLLVDLPGLIDPLLPGGTTSLRFNVTVPRSSHLYPEHRFVPAGCGVSIYYPRVETETSFTYSIGIDSCTLPIDLVVVASGPGAGEEVMLADDLTVSEGTTVDLTDRVFEAPPTHSLTINVPLGKTWQYGRYVTLHDRASYGGMGPTYPGQSDSWFEGSQTFEVPTLDPPASTDPAAVTEVYSNYWFPTQHRIVDRGPLSPSSVVDVASRMLTDIVETPVLDTDAGTLSWETQGEGRTPNLVVTDLSWRLPDPRNIASVQWTVISPSDALVRLPMLPPELTDWSVDPEQPYGIVTRMAATVDHAALRDRAPWSGDRRALGVTGETRSEGIHR